MIKRTFLKKINFSLNTPSDLTKKICFSKINTQRTHLNQSSSLPVLNIFKNCKESNKEKASLFKQTTLPELKSCSLQRIVSKETKLKLSKRKKKKYSERYQLLLNNLYHYDPIQERLLNKIKKDNSIVQSQNYSLEKYQTNLVTSLYMI